MLWIRASFTDQYNFCKLLKNIYNKNSDFAQKFVRYFPYKIQRDLMKENSKKIKISETSSEDEKKEEENEESEEDEIVEKEEENMEVELDQLNDSKDSTYVPETQQASSEDQ